MRTLDQITAAVRRGEPVTELELRLAVASYDVLMARLEVEKSPTQLQEYFIAGDSTPENYLGVINDPRNPESVGWHRSMIAS